MSGNWQLMTVNSGYINGPVPDEMEEEFDDDEEWLEKAQEYLARNTRESPLPEPEDLFESDDENQHAVAPTTNANGKEAPLPDVEMDWSTMGSDA